MKHPLFKTDADSPLSSQEEKIIARDLAAAYQQSEQAERTPEFHRVANSIQKLLINPSVSTTLPA